MTLLFHQPFSPFFGVFFIFTGHVQEEDRKPKTDFCIQYDTVAEEVAPTSNIKPAEVEMKE